MSAGALLLVLCLVAGVWRRAARPLAPVPAAATSAATSAPAELRPDARAEPTSRTKRDAPASEPTPAPAPAESGVAAELVVDVRCGAPAEPAGAAFAVRLSRLSRSPSAGRSALTDVRGAATFARLEPGTWLVTTDRGGKQRAELSAGERRRVTLVVPPGPRLAGLVVTPAGEPAPGARVHVSNALSTEDAPTAAVADERGAFVLRDAGKVRVVWATHEELAPSETLNLGVYSGELDALRLELGDGGTRVRGVVRDADGAPLAGAHVALVPATGPWRPFDAPPARQSAATDERGRFALRVRPSIYAVSASTPDGASAERTVEARAGETLDVELRVAGWASAAGRVRGVDGAAVGDATVSFVAPSGRTVVWARAGEDGRFVLERLPALAGTLVASVGKGDGVRKAIEPASGDEVAWDPVLFGEAALVGEVVDADGAAVRGAYVFLVHRGASGSGSSGTWTDASGAFAFEPVACGPCTVTVACPPRLDVGRLKQEVWIGEGPVVLRLDDDGFVTSPVGAVHASDGAPLEGASVTLRPLDEDWRERVLVGQTDENGSFTLDSWPTGLYELRVSKPGYAAQEHRVQLLRTPASDLGTFVLEPGGDVVVELFAGVEIGDIVRIRALSADESRYPVLGEVLVDEIPQRTTLEALGSGEYTLVVSSRAASDDVSNRVRVRVEPGRTTHVAVRVLADGARE